MFAPVVNATSPIFVINESIQEMIEVCIINTYSTIIQVGSVNVHKIIERFYVKDTSVDRTADFTIVKNCIISFLNKLTEMYFKWSIPSLLVPKTPFYFL